MNDDFYTVVYFESPGHLYAEIAAILRDEDLYMKCLPALEKQAKEEGFIITENCEAPTEEVIRILKQ